MTVKRGAGRGKAGRARAGAKKPLPDLVRRNRSLIAVQEKFGGKAFELGKADCIQLVRLHLVRMGHQRLPSGKGYSSPAGVTRTLKAMGVENLEQLFDRLLVRIPPAAMLPGDIALVAAEEGAPAWRAGTVVISVGRKFLGWHPDHPMLAVIDPNVEQPFVAAWRA